MILGTIQDGKLHMTQIVDAPQHVEAGKPIGCFCGDDLQGTQEVTYTVALATAYDDGEVHFDGETESDYVWDNQETVYIDRDGTHYPVLVCMSGHEFTHGDVTEVH